MIVDYSMQQVIEQGVATRLRWFSFWPTTRLDLITQKSETPLLLPAKSYEDQPCHRVRIDSEYGSLVLWIDKASYVLRRIDFPIASFKPREQTYGGPVSDLTLFADFTGEVQRPGGRCRIPNGDPQGELDRAAAMGSRPESTE